MSRAMAIAGVAAALLAGPVDAEPVPGPPPAGHVTGLGGVFFRSKDPKALMAWYRDVLGVKLEAWGGAALRYDAPGHPPVAVLNAMSEHTRYLAPSTREVMLDFAVDNLDALLARLKARGVSVLGTSPNAPEGRFAWILDSDGTKVELWQPAPP